MGHRIKTMSNKLRQTYIQYDTIRYGTMRYTGMILHETYLCNVIYAEGIQSPRPSHLFRESAGDIKVLFLRTMNVRMVIQPGKVFNPARGDVQIATVYGTTLKTTDTMVADSWQCKPSVRKCITR